MPSERTTIKSLIGFRLVFALRSVRAVLDPDSTGAIACLVNLIPGGRSVSL